jgi:hypothetical protein
MWACPSLTPSRNLLGSPTALRKAASTVEALPLAKTGSVVGRMHESYLL